VVSATTVQASRGGVSVFGPDGRRVTYRHADLSDPADPHGVSRDEADDIAEQLGYLVGVFRWNAEGGFYKAVATPVEGRRKVSPKYSDEDMARWRASPEGQRHAAAMRKHRSGG
jgi:hypothetical protein